MDNLFLDDFFDKFSNELERKRETDNRHDRNLIIAAEEISDILSKITVRNIKKPSRFRNPRLYYRIDILSYTSLESVLSDLESEFMGNTTFSKIEDIDFFYIGIGSVNFVDENNLIIRGFYRSEGMVSLELIFSEEIGVLEFSEMSGIYSVIYFYNGTVNSSTFHPVGNNLYSSDELLFSPDLKSKNPGNSKIYLEQ